MNVIPVTIDRSSPVPLYHQLAEQLTASIEDGRLKPGDPFENELALAERLDLSRPTVRRAIAELVNRGLLVRRRGVGTTVASQVIHRRDELTSLYDDMVRRGQQPRTEVLSFSTDDVNPVAAEALGVPADSPPGLGRAAAHRRRHAHRAHAQLAAAPVRRPHRRTTSRTRASTPSCAPAGCGRSSRTRPSAPAGPEPASAGCSSSPSGDPLLTMTRKAYAANGSAVEYGDHCYRYDQYAFDVTVLRPLSERDPRSPCAHPGSEC